MSQKIFQLFELLDKWRHFPNYQLERRVDIFFALYLSEILEIKNIRNITTIIPEFPVRIGEISKHTELNKSYKIDYVVIHDCNKVLFVELKTDPKSRRKKQDDYLKSSKNIGFQKILNGLLKIYSATSSKMKYQALLDELVICDVLSKYSAQQYSVPERAYDEEIIFIQPTNESCDKNVITFHEIAHRLEGNGQTAKRFAESLIQWAEIKAGERRC